MGLPFDCHEHGVVEGKGKRQGLEAHEPKKAGDQALQLRGRGHEAVHQREQSRAQGADKCQASFEDELAAEGDEETGGRMLGTLERDPLCPILGTQVMPVPRRGPAVMGARCGRAARGTATDCVRAARGLNGNIVGGLDHGARGTAIDCIRAIRGPVRGVVLVTLVTVGAENNLHRFILTQNRGES